jgi:TRAP transporter TAXI family solute receptor
MRIMEAGGAGLDSSFVSGSSLVSATLGRPPFEGKPLQNLRAAFPLGQAPVVLVARGDANINGLKDLNGKRVTAGPTGTGNDIMMRGLIGKVATGTKPSYVTLPHASFASALQDGKVDAVFILGWPPYPAVVETAALMKIKYVPFSEDEMKTWLADNPQHHRMVLKAGMNPQQSVDIQTFGHVSHLIVPQRLDAEVIYQLTKAWLRPDVRKQLLNASSTWEAAFMAFDSGLYFRDLEALKAKLHPGAVRAYQEAGIKVPAAIVP